MNDKRTIVLNNFIWRFFERFGAQLISFVVSIILARILLPDDFGTVALVSAFINFLSVFVNSGFSSALIQKKDADALDFSSVFYVQLVFCLVLYIVLFVSAPLTSSFFHRPELTSMLRVLGIILLIGGIKNIQISYVSKKLIFRKFFFATLGGTIVSAIIGIRLAAEGWGAWALIVQILVNNAVDTLILWVTVDWRPENKFSFERVKKLFGYGWKIFASELLDAGYNNVQNLIIGKKYSSSELAYYDKGRRFPEFAVVNVNASIDNVMFPVVAEVQEKTSVVKQMTARSVKLSTYVITPMVIGLAACAEPLVRLLLTEKWMECVFFLRAFCFMYVFWPVHTVNLSTIKALGHSEIFLKLEIVKKIIGTVILLMTMRISVGAMAVGLVADSFICQLINIYPNRRLIGYGFFEQMKDIFPNFALAGFMGVSVYFVSLTGWSDVIVLPVQVLLGAAIYVSGSIVLKNENFRYIVSLLKK